jgi:hypothetical protein
VRLVESEGAVVAEDATGDRFVPVYDSAAVIGRHDPLTRFVRTVAMTNGWELTGWGIPVLPAEAGRWSALPRLEVPGGGPGTATTVVGARRWVIGADALATIRAAPDEAGRYLRWRAELDRRAVPSTVLARWALRPDAAELALPTDSPLALRCLCDQLPDGPAALVLSELPGPRTAWPVHSADGHHLSELAVTWVRRPDVLDPATFPGGTVAPTFLAALDALRDSASGGRDPSDDAGSVAARARAVLDELVDPDARDAVAARAGAWLTRVADRQDPAGSAGSGASTTPDPGVGTVVGAGDVGRLRTNLRALRPGFDADVGTIAAGELDALSVRSQLVARLVHLDAIDWWGEGPDRLRAEAAMWHGLTGGRRRDGA